MSERNELIPANGDGASGDGRGADGGAEGRRGRFRDWLKNPFEIQQAIDKLMQLSALGVVPERKAKLLIDGLKLQLECFKAGEGKASSQAGTGPEIDAAAEFFEKNPELLRDMTPLMDPESLQEILKRLDDSR